MILVKEMFPDGEMIGNDSAGRQDEE